MCIRFSGSLPPSQCVLFYLMPHCSYQVGPPDSQRSHQSNDPPSPCLFPPGEVKLPLVVKPRELRHLLLIYHPAFQIVQASPSFISPQSPPLMPLATGTLRALTFGKAASALKHVWGPSLSRSSAPRGSTQLPREQPGAQWCRTSCDCDLRCHSRMSDTICLHCRQCEDVRFRCLNFKQTEHTLRSLLF